MDKLKKIVFGTLIASFIVMSGCDSKQPAVSKGREAVKEVVTQPFNTLDAAKESLDASEAKRKEALEAVEKEFKN